MRQLIGNRGVSYYNVLDETINGLYRAEMIRKLVTLKARESVDIARLNCVYWFNHHRPIKGLGYIPSVEVEAKCYFKFTG